MSFWTRKNKKEIRHCKIVKKRLQRKIESNPKLIDVIPEGKYCYNYVEGKRVYCPYLEINKNYSKQNNGYCSLLEVGDWENGTGILWDACKICGIKYEFGGD